jgi:hypothetical protein
MNRRAHAGKAVHQEADQRAVAQADQRVRLDGIEQCTSFLDRHQ